MNFVSYFFSDKIALAMYRAQPVTREQLPRAYQVVGAAHSEDGHSHAQDLRDPDRFAQCLCHRAQSRNMRPSRSPKAF